MQWQLVPWWMATMGIVFALARLALLWTRRVKPVPINNVILLMVTAKMWPQAIAVCHACRRYLYTAALHDTLVFAAEQLRGQRELIPLYERLTQSFTANLPKHIKDFYRGVWIENTALLLLLLPLWTLAVRSLRPPSWGWWLLEVLVGLMLVGSTKQVATYIAMDAGAGFLALARPLAMTMCNEADQQKPK